MTLLQRTVKQRTRNLTSALTGALAVGLAQFIGCIPPVQIPSVQATAAPAAGQESEAPAASSAAAAAVAAEPEKGVPATAPAMDGGRAAAAPGQMPPAEQPAATAETPAAQEPAPAQPAAREPAATPSGGPATPEEAPQLLAELQALVDQGKLLEAAAQVEALDPLRAGLTDDQKLDYDELRSNIAQTARMVRPLTRADALARAREHFDLGARAYEAKDYAAALRQLDMAQSFGVGLGWWDDRKLRSMHADAQDTLGKLRTDYEAGKKLLAEGDYKGARDLLRKVKDSGVTSGPEEGKDLDGLLSVAEEGLKQELQRQQEEQKNRAAELLAQATDLVTAGKYAEAAPVLADLRSLQGALSPEQAAGFEQLCSRVEEATGILPGMTPEERLAKAEECFSDGMAAYARKDYGDAQPYLDKAAALGVSLGWIDNRSLRSAREKVNQTLSELLPAYKDARADYDSGNYTAAKEKLVKLTAAGIGLGKAQDVDVKAMLTDIDVKVRTQEVEQARKRQEDADKMAAEASRMMAAQEAVFAKAKEADQAWQAEDFAQAKTLLGALREQLNGLDIAADSALADVARQTDERLAAVDQKIQQKQQRNAAVAQLNGMIDEAVALTKTDLGAAQKKVLAVQRFAEGQGLALTEAQNTAVNSVFNAVEAGFGAKPRLRLEEYGRLAELSEQYSAAGEYEKAIRVLELVKDAAPDVVPVNYRNAAVARITAMADAQQSQEKQAGEFEASLDAAGEALKRGDVRTALDVADGIVGKAEEAKLSAPSLTRILDKEVSVLEAGCEPAMTAMQEEFKAGLDRQLAAIEPSLQYALCTYYLDHDSPDLADPCLRKLVATDTAFAGWARQQLGALDQKKIKAEQASLTELAPETERVYQLAEKLHGLAKEGRLDEARAVEQDLADARLTLQTAKAARELQRGAYAAALSALEEVPLDKASKKLVETTYRPVATQLDLAVQADAKIGAAEAAAVTHDADSAIARLGEAQAILAGATAGAKPLEMRRDALALVLDAVRGLQQNEMTLRAQEETQVRGARARLEDLQARQTAWRRYYDAVSGFLAGNAEAPGALRKLAQGTSGLKPFELENAQMLVSGFEADEKKAEDLYARTVEAYKAGDAKRLQELLLELKSKYGDTKVYEDHM